jgi:TonB family protein
MKSTHAILIGAGVATFIGTLAAQQVSRLTPAEARQHAGEVATVCGSVIATRCDPGKTALLDLRTLTGSGTVSVAIPQADRAAFGDRVESRHDLRDVCATGPIERIGVDYRVTVSSPDKLRIEREPAGRALPQDEAFTTCDQGVSVPRVQQDVRPRYTRDAMQARIEGKVVMQGVVAVDGTVQGPRVVYSLDPSLDEQALRAFSQWRFAPGTRNAQPVPVAIMVEMTFTLK